MYTIRELDHEIAAGDVQFWSCDNSAMVTRIVHHDGADRIGQADWVVGDIDEIVAELIPQAEAGFWKAGCARIMFEGRLGWKRILKGHGYRDYSVTLIKDAV